MALTTCGECGNQVSDRAASCPRCGAPVAAGPALLPAGGSPMAVVAPAPASSEVTFYTDQTGIRITNTRAIIGARTYSMANLTTVTTAVTPPDKRGPIWLMVIGA